MFDAKAYKQALQKTSDITECEKVPVPVIRDEQNYIFISYSHKDYKQVYSDLADMYEAGVRFWYDYALRPDKDWDETVLDRITNPHCTGVIFYLSKNLFLSAAIKREISIVVGRNEITGAIERPGKPYFYVNLMECDPSDIITLVTREEKKAKNLDSQWIELLMHTFRDRKTYPTFSLPNHKDELIRFIDDMFNVRNDSDVTVMVDGDYRGDRKNGKRHGKGVFEDTRGYQYDGDWVDDQRCGTGVLSRNGKVVYKGDWKDDRREGNGDLYEDCGDVYRGEWKNNKFHGHGVYTYAEGDRRKSYDGNWENGQKNGKGKLVFKDGGVYEGFWENDAYHGTGVFRFSTGAIYDGEWKGSRYHGHGVFTFPEGDNRKCYDGEWIEGKGSGKGKLVFASGATYDGDLENDTYHGHGVFTYADDSTYDGEWANGKRSGHGILTYAGGEKWVGEFKNDEKWAGSGTLFYYKNGERTGESYVGDLVGGNYHGHGVYTYAESSHIKYYDGEWVNGKKSGKGKMVFKEGYSYDGDWENDTYHGHGIYTYAESSRIKYYDGEWVNGKKSGKGKMVYKEGDRYDGDWENDTYHGHGVYTYAESKQWKLYDGEWKGGKKSGKGKLVFRDGDSYEGDWENDTYHGHGVYTFAESSRIKYYDGEWVNGKKSGKGKMVFASGAVYEGEYQNNSRHGHGVFMSANGDTYDGEWENDKRSGHGVFTYNSGEQWVGEFKNGEKWTGSGTLFYYKNGERTGESYVGDLVEGKNHGHGVLTYAEGDHRKSYDGEWKDDKISGKGKMIFTNRDVYEGEYQNNSRHGHGVFMSANGDTYDGEWENDKRSGHGVYTYAESSRIKYYDGEWVNDKKSGKGKMVYKDGVSYDGDWENDTYHGHGVFTYADGEQWIGEFKEGFKWTGSGTIIYFDSNGKRSGEIYVGELAEGTRNGHGRCKYADGSVYEGEWKDGKREGKGCMTDPLAGAPKPLGYTIKDGIWKGGSFVEGSRLIKRITSDGTYKVVSCIEGKFDYNGNPIGVIQRIKKNRARKKVAFPQVPIFLPNLWIFRIMTEDTIWQFESDESNTPEGYGKAIYCDGKSVEGVFRGGKTLETETYSACYPDGRTYVGGWVNGAPSGHGKMTYPDGNTYDGDWKNGSRDGHGVYTWADGDTYDGEWKDDDPDGYGTRTEPDGTVSSGTWKKGKLRKSEKKA